MSIQAEIQATVTLVDSSDHGSGRVADSLDFIGRLAFADGTGALKAQVQYRGKRTMGGASENLDLAGSLANPKNRVVTITKAKGLLIHADPANGGNLTVKFNPANGWVAACSGEVVLHPGALLLLATPDANGWAVTAGTGDQVQVQGAAGRIYEVLIFGEGSEA